MNLRPVALFGIGNNARSVNVNAQDRLNLYVEVNDDPEKHVLTLYPTPGLVSVLNLGAFPARGLHQLGNFLYLVERNKLIRVANDFTTDEMGTLNSTEGRVDMEDNGNQLMVVDGTDGYILQLDAKPGTISSITRVSTTATLTTSAAHGLQTGMIVTVSGATPSQYNGTFAISVTGASTFTYTMASDPGASASPVGSYTITSAFAPIGDADFPGADTVTFLNQRFIVQQPDSGRFYCSGLLDGWSWDALDFATVESDPDNLVRVMAEGGQLYLFGEKTTEIWGDSGAQDFPYAKVGGGAVEWGLAARWSLVKYLDSMAFLRKNRLGQVQACVMSGGAALPISNPQVEAQFTSYGDVSNATALAYMMNGHAFYQVNFPSEGVSWLYDAQSKSWSRLQSGSGAHRAAMCAQLLGSVYAADRDNGKLYRIDSNAYTDDGVAIVREFVSRHQSGADLTSLAELWLEVESGVGLQQGQGSAPTISLQVSRDGGHTWGPELWRSFGRIGQYRLRAKWNRLGRSRDWLFKFRVTDPVKTVFVAAWGRIAK